MPLLSESEARAEAAVIVLRILLFRMPAKQLMALAAQARRDAKTIGVPAINEELDWLLLPD